MTRSSRLAAGAAGLLLACASRFPELAPRPLAVSPASGSPFVATPVVVTGDGFEGVPYQSATGVGGIDTTFRAWLGGVELEGVTWVSATELHAVVPAGVPSGPQRLEVRDARGSSGALDAAFTVDEAEQVLDDPFGDGTAFAFVFGYHDRLTLGPGGAGSAVVSCLPDGTGCATFAFSFAPDVTGTPSQNTLCPTLTTLGAQPYCSATTPQTTPCACGPDYESGRGVMGSATLGGQEWLVAMGRTQKTGQLTYLYMTSDAASPLAFSYVDLFPVLPPSAGAESATAFAVLNDRLYAGVQVIDANRPLVAMLTRTPTPPGLDCTSSDVLATTFQQTSMGESGSGISQVDAMLGFEGRLFVANRAAVLVSKTGFPTGAADASTDFDDCTPPAAGGWEATSIGKYTAKIDQTPADKGVTGLVAWQGRLYLARNTLAPPPPVTTLPVPELWAFTPRHDPATGAFLGCAPGDWQLVATDFGDPTSGSLTALLATSAHLYVGYDSASGARLFRASAPPASEADFRGRWSCVAPCAPFGLAGLGDPTNTRFLDARGITLAGVDEVWAVVGTGVGPARIYRLADR